MPDFKTLLTEIGRGLERSDIPFMIIGGQAVLVHGEPRLTQDIDVTLGVDPSRFDDVLAACREIGLQPLPEDPESFALETFVLPVEDRRSGVRVDLIFSSTEYEGQAIARAEPIETGAGTVAFATAEDLIIHKLFAGRPRDIEDAAGVVRRKGGGLDWDYLRVWASTFAEIPGREEMPDQIEWLWGRHAES